MDYTPRELEGALLLWLEEQEQLIRNDWERTRLQTFFLFTVHLARKSKMTYDQFSRKQFPLSWDNEGKKASKDNPQEGVMTVSDWQKVLERKKLESKTVGTSQIVSL